MIQILIVCVVVLSIVAVVSYMISKVLSKIVPYKIKNIVSLVALSLGIIMILITGVGVNSFMDDVESFKESKEYGIGEDIGGTVLKNADAFSNNISDRNQPEFPEEVLMNGIYGLIILGLGLGIKLELYLIKEEPKPYLE